MRIKCNNCGRYGHVFRKCTYPRTSIGVILYLNYKNTTYFLQIQRKDTIGFIDFIRGKYDVRNMNYIKKLFSIMTKKEHNLLLTKSFDELWNIVWIDNSEENKIKYRKSFLQSQIKFDKIKKGVIHSGQTQNIASIIAKSSYYTDTEWGFPKGRRETNETNLDCANREVFEETGLRYAHDYTIRNQKDLITLYFKGINKIDYKHIFFIGEVKDLRKLNIRLNIRNKYQLREIKNIKWHSMDDILNHTRAYNSPYIFKIMKKLNYIFHKNAKKHIVNTIIDESISTNMENNQ